MKDKQLPTIKGELAKMEASLRYDLTFSSIPRDRVITLAFNEIIKVYDEVLLAHEQHAKEMMIRAGKKMVEEQFKDSITFAKNKQEFDYWKGAYERLQALKGEVKK